MHKRIPLAVLLILLVAALAGCAPLQARSPGPSLTVLGTGKVMLVPELATLNVGVHSEAAEAASAVLANNAQAQQVMAAVRALGVAEQDARTLGFSIYPRQDYDPQSGATRVTYVVDNVVEITLRDVQQVGAALEAAAAAGANRIDGLKFDVVDRRPLVRQARELALQDAQAQAEAIARAAGVELGRLRGVSPMPHGDPLPIDLPASAGMLTIVEDVTAVYEIR